MSLTFLIQRPVAVLTIVVGLLVLGAVCATIIPISLLPETAIPQLAVQLNYTGAAASELDKTIVAPIRNQLLQVNSLKDLESETRDGQANISLTFDFGTNTDLAFIEVNEKIDQIASYLPRDMERPSVLKASVTDIPVFYLSVVPKNETNDPLALSTFTRTILKRRIEQLPQVAFVDISGFAEAQISVLPKVQQLQRLGLSVGDVANILKENNLDLGSVLVQDGQYQYNVRFRFEVKTKEDIADIYFRHDGQVLQLKDIADVQLEAQTRRGLYLFNDQEAIVLAIRKQADAQLFDLKEAFEELLVSLEADYPDLAFQVSNDQSKLLTVSIENLRTSLLYGIAFAVLFMFFFFRSWKAPLLIAFAIPVSLLLALIGFYLLNISINIISLSGLILGVGLMIDNSIIVIENIQQYRDKGFDQLDACAQGANEVIRPLISSALTTCSVFLPLIFLSGLAGELFYDQAVSITIALLASLLVAYILLPTLLYLFHTSSKQTSSSKNAPFNFYTRSVDFVLRFRWLFLLFFFGLIGSSYLFFRQLPQASFPPLSRTAFALSIDWNEPISLEENRKRIEAILQKVKDIEFANSFIGEQQFLLTSEQQSINQAEVLLFLEENKIDLLHELQRKFIKQYSTATFQIEPLKNIFDEVFGSDQAPVVMHIQLANSNELPQPKDLSPIVQILKRQGLDVPLPPMKQGYEISIQRDKILHYEIGYETIEQKLRALFNDYNIGTLKTSNVYMPIVIGEAYDDLYTKIEAAKIENRQGSLLPLSQFVQLKAVQNYKTITATKGGTAINLDIPTEEDGYVPNMQRLLKNVHKLSVSFSGQLIEDQKTIRSLTLILGVSLLLLYLILAAQFESLTQPFIVMLTVPVGLFGSMLFLWFFQQSINIISIIGVIVMSGIVVNDAILKVDMMNRSIKNYNLIEAIHEAGKRRLKPIIMTSLTTIFALVPILFASGLGAELQRPLAYAVIGGLILGTISSLYFVPILYFLFTKDKFNRS